VDLPVVKERNDDPHHEEDAAITAALGLALLTGCSDDEPETTAAPEPVIQEQPLVEVATAPAPPQKVTVTIRDQRGEPWHVEVSPDRAVALLTEVVNQSRAEVAAANVALLENDFRRLEVACAVLSQLELQRQEIVNGLEDTRADVPANLAGPIDQPSRCS
jgi:hypothetical protein